MTSIYHIAKSLKHGFVSGKVLLALFLVFTIASSQAQTVTVGTTTSTNQYLPLDTYYGNNYSETIYLASELTTAGATGASYITAISFFYDGQATPESAWEDWEIFMNNTSKTSFANGTDWVTGNTKVFAGKVSAPSSAGQWMTVTLNTPFLWNGSDNLVVGVHENSPGYTNAAANWAHTTSNDKRSLLYFDDSTDPNPTSPPSANNQIYGYASAMFGLVPFTNCAGTPSAGITVSTSYSVCTNTPFSLSLSGSTPASGLSYQWQSSPNGSTWTNMGSSQNNWSYAISNQTVTTYYRCVTTCINSSTSNTSTPVSVTQKSIINCFCQPASLDCNNGYALSGIDFSNLSNYSPVCTPGGNSYQDLTGIAPTISVTAGQAYTFTTSTSQSGDFILGTWIDYNNSGVFDSWEYSPLASGSTSGNYTSTVTIPFTAQATLVKMRLQLESGNGTTQNPCGANTSDGQVLDFLVNITGLPTCAGTPTAGAAVSSSVSVCPNSPYTLDLTGTSGASGMNFQWQSSLNGTTWTNLGSVQSHVPYSVSTQTATTHYRCIVTCPASAMSSTSTPVVVNQTSFLLCYCNPGVNNCDYTNFTAVNFATINTASITCSGTGYEDLTTTTGTVTAGQTYTLSTDISTDQTLAYASAWIDFNHNGIFDSYELIQVGSTSNASAITFTTAVTIPFTATGGLTMMRLRTEAGNYEDPMDPCMDNQYNGHTIDYHLFINAAPACSGTPNAGTAISSVTTACPGAPFTLDLNGNSQVSGGSYQWQYSLNNTTWTNLGSAQSHVPYTVSGQSVATYYRCVVTCVTSSSSQNSTSVLVTKNTFLNCYCVVGPQDCSGGDEINNVVMGTVLSNTSACSANAYSDYSSSVPTATITAGTSYTMDVTIGNDYSENVSVWIDYDQNGTFDAAEYTFLGSTNGTYTVSGTMVIPAGATAGHTKMRVRNQYSYNLSGGEACDLPPSSPDRLLQGNTYGETEDYSIYILPANCNGQNLPSNMSLSASASTVCPNGAVTLSITSTIPAYTGYTYQWQSSSTGSAYTNVGAAVTNSSLTVNPAQSTYYICDILCNGSPAATTSSVLVTVNGSSINITAGSYTICPAEPITITASGVTTYTWSNTSVHTATIAVTPTIATTYTVTGTDNNGCTASNTVTIAVNPATGITGTITTGASVPVAGTAILYKYEPFFTKFDSVTSQAIAANGAYNFTSVNYGTYIVKAVPTANTLQVTYGTNSVNWKTATLIHHACATADVQNIDVVPLTVLGTGPGSMSGRITEGQGYGQRPSSPYSPLAPGQPIGGIVVKGGKNPGGNMFAQTTTDANGTYTLSNLPTNSEYFILVDIPGLDTNGTYYRMVTLTNLQYINLDFIVDSAKISPVQSPVGINSLSLAENKISVYPNPAKGKISVAYTLASASEVSIELYDIVGKSIKTIAPKTEQAAGEHTYQVMLNDLSAGMYLVKLRINEGETSVKLFITD